MSLDKGIQSGKEHRREWRHSKAIDPSCRCHGGCEWCLRNRMHKYNKIKEGKAMELKEWERNG